MRSDVFVVGDTTLSRDVIVLIKTNDFIYKFIFADASSYCTLAECVSKQAKMHLKCANQA